jgi:hypothetical protein
MSIGRRAIIPAYVSSAHKKKLGCNGKRHCSPFILDAGTQSGGALTGL